MSDDRAIKTPFLPQRDNINHLFPVKTAGITTMTRMAVMFRVLLLTVVGLPIACWGFTSHPSAGWATLRFNERLAPSTTDMALRSKPITTSLSMANKLWDRMEIEEDEEIFWYVLNCVAGLEIDLLRQCRQRCEDMEDVEKFVVPMITTTRSHGANRMVKDTKVKYQGYVFAKLRLCPQAYEAIQELDLCRSWMGTINQKGHKKLPPAPVALNEDEIESFGLEDLESEEPEEPEEDDVILDTAEADKEAAEMEETVQKVYLGLRVGDMVKVTAKNKFFDEDAIVRRLKDDKLFLRFYTYGTMFEEWMDPSDVRKLSETEVMNGLSGPQEPITQRDFDDPERNSMAGYDGRGPSRRNLVSNEGRNRRQDRIANKFKDESEYDRRRNEDNWNWYKDNENQKQGGRGYQDGDVELRGSDYNRKDGDKWAQGDVDSQWGRTSQRENRRQKRERQPNSGGDDWSEFVSSSPATPSQAETDDFFASLMTDLSNDLGSEQSGGGGKKASGQGSGDSSGDDDFFASLISEIEEDSSAPGTSSLSSSDDDDFFASLEDEIRGTSKPNKKEKKGATASEELDDFFSELGAFDDLASDPTSSGDDGSDFFAGLEAELEAELSPTQSSKNEADSSSSTQDDDFFSDGMFDDILSDDAEPVESKKNGLSKQSASSEPAASSSAPDQSNLEKCTVPVLKDMLRERGLKVSGKKSDLIERLSQAA